MENQKIDVADLVPYLGQVVRIGSEHVRLHAILADGVVEAPQGYYRKAAEVALLESPESSSVDPEAIPVQDDPEPVQPEVDPFSTVEHELKPLATDEVVERGDAPSAPATQGPDENFSF